MDCGDFRGWGHYPFFSLLPFSLMRRNGLAGEAKCVQSLFILCHFCQARKLFGVTSNEQIKPAEISPGMRHSLPCVLWHAASDYKDSLYSACFICHLFPIWTL